MERMRNWPPAQIAIAEMQRSRRFDALEARCDEVGRLLRRHHAHVDFGAENGRIELDVRAAFVGHRAQLLIDDLCYFRNLRTERIELVAPGHGDFVRSYDGRLANAAGQILFAPKRFQIAEPARRGKPSDDLRMRHVVIVENVIGLRFVDLQSGQTFVHVQDEIVGVIFAAAPFVEAKVALFRNGFGRRPVEDRFAFLRRQLARVVTRQILLHFGMKPPRPDDSGADGHFKSSPCLMSCQCSAYCSEVPPAVVRPGTCLRSF
jgi:hypothetical protein